MSSRAEDGSLNVNVSSGDHGNASHPSALARMSWAQLHKRVFANDMEHCRQCGGALKIIAHLGLSARAPPRSPARPFH